MHIVFNKSLVYEDNELKLSMLQSLLRFLQYGDTIKIDYNPIKLQLERVNFG